MKYLSFIIFFIFGFSSLALFTNMDKQKDKPQKLPPQNVFSGKARTAFTNQIEIIEYNNQKAILQAKVKRRSSNESFSYQWHLPDNVQILKGNRAGEVLDTTTGNYSFTITVTWSDWIDGEMIFFKIRSPTNIGRTAVWYPTEDLKEGENLVGLQKASKKKKVELPDWVKVMQ